MGKGASSHARDLAHDQSVHAGTYVPMKSMGSLSACAYHTRGVHLRVSTRTTAAERDHHAMSR